MESVWKAMHKKFRKYKKCKHVRKTDYVIMQGAYVPVEVCTKCKDGHPSLIVYVDTDPNNNGYY
jgi:hypothetical protein